MKAKLKIVRLELPIPRIRATGGVGQSPFGHDFDFLPIVKVDKRTLGGMSGEGIDVPALQWKERIEWFSAPPAMGARGQLVMPNQWKYVGDNTKDMYAENPTSNTFKNWHKLKFLWACQSPPNTPPPGLAAMLQTGGGDVDAIDKAAKHWIAIHGFQWQVPDLCDRPGMGLTGGSGGGGGASLVTSSTRRRVIYFDLGFAGHPVRIKFVQILETVSGVPTIHKFVNADVTKVQVDNPVNLARWRTQVATPLNLAF